MCSTRSYTRWPPHSWRTSHFSSRRGLSSWRTASFVFMYLQGRQADHVHTGRQAGRQTGRREASEEFREQCAACDNAWLGVRRRSVYRNLDHFAVPQRRVAKTFSTLIKACMLEDVMNTRFRKVSLLHPCLLLAEQLVLTSPLHPATANHLTKASC